MLKSGQESSVYLNIREVISSPELVRAIANLMWGEINPCKFDLLCGVPYTALPFATCLSLQHNVPLIMRRKEKKAYGTKQQIEGIFQENQRCLIIEDVTTSGSSVLETIADIKKYNLAVSDVVTLIDREQGAASNLQQNDCQLHAVMTITEILTTLATATIVNDIDREHINKLLTLKANNTPRLSFTERAALSQNNLTKQLLLLMEEKQSNLVLSADVSSATELLDLIKLLGQEIVVLKTHIDMLNDFTPELIQQVIELAKKQKFLLFEDRKFADIGNTVRHQYQDGIYKIASWADIISAHSLAGRTMLQALATIASQQNRGVLLIAQMSNVSNLLDQEYYSKTLALAAEFPEIVSGFVVQKKFTDSHPQWLYMRPGVHLEDNNDNFGQQYVTPQQAIIGDGCDMIIVGRGIIAAQNPLLAAQQYRQLAWQAYQDSLASGPVNVL